MSNKPLTYLSLVKFSHTIFAMPFALTGFFLAAKQNPSGIDWKLFLLVVLCMVFARNSAMGFNRYADKDFDSKNQRTANREIPRGLISPGSALMFVIINVLLFITTTYFINRICFYLSPVALLIVLGYSFTKRFTALCHFVLGLGLSLAPIGAYLSVTGEFALLPVIFSFIVLFWVSGFDIIYALQDVDFDSSLKLKSIPVFMGIKNALWLSSSLHFLVIALVVVAGIINNAGIFYISGALIFTVLLIYQHLIVKPGDLSRVNMAFATMNGFASIIYAAFTITDILLK